MKIKYGMYNIPHIIIDDAITSGTPAVVGTQADYDILVKLVDQSGAVIIDKATVGGSAMKGCLTANHYHDDVNDGIDLGCVSNFGGNQTVITGTLAMDDDDLKLTLVVSTLE